MIDETKLKANFAEFCRANGLNNSFVDVQIYNIRDDFYTANTTAWDKISETCGDWIRVDLDAWFKSENPSVPEDLLITEEVYESVDEHCWLNAKEWCVEDDAGYDIFNEELETMMYSQLSDEMKSDLDGWWNELELDNAAKIEAVVEALGNGDLEEQYDISRFIDDLGYWTTFFEPAVEDIEAAFKSNLLPFEQDGVFMLGLGGCGQDMQPNLDCYQALTDRSLPSNSKALDCGDEYYFNHVSPIKAADVREMCKRDTPKVVFNAYGKRVSEENIHKFSFIGYTNVIAHDEDEARTKFDDLSDIPEFVEAWDININDSEAVESDCGFGIEAKRYFFNFMGIMKIEAETSELALEKLKEIIEANVKLTVENIILEE